VVVAGVVVEAVEVRIVLMQSNSKKEIREGFLLAFGELFLKSEGVKKFLKKRLLTNLSSLLKKKEIQFTLFILRERVFVEVKDFEGASAVLKNLFGISWYARAILLEGAVLEDIDNFVRQNYKEWIRKEESFALRLKRGSFAEKSTIEATEIIAKNIDRKVDLDNPEKEIFIEARKQGWFVYFEKEKGAGGLPVGSQGKALSLISGGIDSPVSSILIAKRGVENTWVHFHSFPLVSDASIVKTRQLAEIFLKYQPKLKVYFIPFSEIQKKIKTNILAKYRVLLYRKTMLKIAQAIAEKENCQALITGESLGQVSSQTLPNLRITNEVSKIPILRPLIGADKEEIINLAKQMGTFEISVQPHEDCCTLFISKHQTAAGNIEVVRKLEKDLDLDKLIKKAIEKSEIELF